MTREWNGHSHRVMVVNSGFSLIGQTYNISPKVAFAITGTKWNRPRFLAYGTSSRRSGRDRGCKEINSLRDLHPGLDGPGLEQDFNSLDAQREAAKPTSRARPMRAGSLIRRRYGDGGFSGGSMERPALQRLLADIEPQDRRHRGLQGRSADTFAGRLRQAGRAVRCHQVSFVSVTQSFNTTTSMGRLTLNVLLSFAQFEREVTSERIRDKIGPPRRRACGSAAWCRSATR